MHRHIVFYLSYVTATILAFSLLLFLVLWLTVKFLGAPQISIYSYSTSSMSSLYSSQCNEREHKCNEHEYHAFPEPHHVHLAAPGDETPGTLKHLQVTMQKSNFRKIVGPGKGKAVTRRASVSNHLAHGMDSIDKWYDATTDDSESCEKIIIYSDDDDTTEFSSSTATAGSY